MDNCINALLTTSTLGKRLAHSARQTDPGEKVYQTIFEEIVKKTQEQDDCTKKSDTQ